MIAWRHAPTSRTNHALRPEEAADPVAGISVCGRTPDLGGLWIEDRHAPLSLRKCRQCVYLLAMSARTSHTPS